MEFTQSDEIQVPAVFNKGSKYFCNRCFNQDQSLFFKDSLGVYCLKCLKFGKSSTYTNIERKKLYLIEDEHYSLNKVIYLSNAQEIASKRCVDAFIKKYNLLVFAVCGSGKTEIVYDVILKALNEKKIICFATPRKDVVLELVPRFNRDFHQVKTVTLYSGTPDKGKIGNLYVSTTHQLINFYRYFDLIILDEVDAFPYYNNKMLEGFVVKSKKKEAPIIYLTATPTKYLKYLMKTKKLKYVTIPARFHKNPIPLPRVKLTKQTLKLIEKGKIPKEIYKWFLKKQQSNRSVFIFVPSVLCGKQIEKILKPQFNCRFVYAEMKERKDVINQFREKKLKFLITTTILERGVTVPNVDVCIIKCDDSIFDERAIVQITGRAGRSKDHPTGDVCLFADVYTLAIKQSIRHIKKMNSKAKKEGLLK